MADDADLVVVLIFGSIVLIYSVLFYLFDEEYRNNFQGGNHSYADERVDKVSESWTSAKNQFNQLAAKFEMLKIQVILFITKPFKASKNMKSFSRRKPTKKLLHQMEKKLQQQQWKWLLKMQRKLHNLPA